MAQPLRCLAVAWGRGPELAQKYGPSYSSHAENCARTERPIDRLAVEACCSDIA